VLFLLHFGQSQSFRFCGVFDVEQAEKTMKNINKTNIILILFEIIIFIRFPN